MTPEPVEWSQIRRVRLSNGKTIGGIGPDHHAYNMTLDRVVRQIPNLRRALVLCDGLLGSALLEVK